MKKLIPQIRYEDLSEREIEEGYVYLLRFPKKVPVEHYKETTRFPQKFRPAPSRFSKFGEYKASL